MEGTGKYKGGREGEETKEEKWEGRSLKKTNTNQGTLKPHQKKPPL